MKISNYLFVGAAANAAGAYVHGALSAYLHSKGVHQAIWEWMSTASNTMAFIAGLSLLLGAMLRSEEP